MAARMLCALLTLVVCMGALHSTRTFAAVVPTEALFAPAPEARVLSRMHTLLARDELRARLIALGVDPAYVEERLAALTPEEAQRLAARMDELPAGGDLAGAVIFIFLVLLITDILGYTDIYPFITRTVNGEKQVAECVDTPGEHARSAAR